LLYPIDEDGLLDAEELHARSPSVREELRRRQCVNNVCVLDDETNLRLARRIIKLEQAVPGETSEEKKYRLIQARVVSQTLRIYSPR
jgi:hypothetical protein